MKRIYCLAAFLILCMNCYAQEAPIKIKDARLVSNTVGDFSLSLDFALELEDSVLINDEYWAINRGARPQPEVVYQGKKNTKCELKTAPYVTRSGHFGIMLSGFDKVTLERFKAKDNQITVQVKENFKIELIMPGGAREVRLVEKDMVNKLIDENLEISDEQRQEFLTALNNYYYYTNHVDMGISPANTNTAGRTSYFLNYTFQNKYNGNILNCDREGDKLPPAVYWSSSGRLSTIFSDSLNFINLYPLNVVWATSDYTLHVRGKLGHESNQTFTNKRVALDFSGSWVLPINLINLTTAKDNRLRLKPIVDFGLKGYYDYSNGNLQNFSSGQAFLNGYYYIPVYNRYCIIFEGKAFYDLSVERNPSKKIMGNYSLTVGAEVPGTGIKAIFKYTDGKTDINYKEGKQVLLGVLMDFLQ